MRWITACNRVASETGYNDFLSIADRLTFKIVTANKCTYILTSNATSKERLNKSFILSNLVLVYYMMTSQAL